MLQIPHADPDGPDANHRPKNDESPLAARTGGVDRNLVMAHFHNSIRPLTSISDTVDGLNTGTSGCAATLDASHQLRVGLRLL